MRSIPLYLQADELIYEASHNRIVARGNVEIYYNNYILTADNVVSDRGSNTLRAEGNVALKDPAGQITRSEHMELPQEFRDGFLETVGAIDGNDPRSYVKTIERK